MRTVDIVISLIPGKSWQADRNLHLYRTDYLVTDHLAGKFLVISAVGSDTNNVLSH